MAEVGGMTYKQAHMYRNALFSLVQNKDNWKNPIDSTIEFHGNPDDFVRAIDDAVVYFVGKKPQFEFQKLESEGDSVNRIRIVCAGYYATVGA